MIYLLYGQPASGKTVLGRVLASDSLNTLVPVPTPNIANRRLEKHRVSAFISYLNASGEFGGIGILHVKVG